MGYIRNLHGGQWKGGSCLRPARQPDKHKSCSFDFSRRTRTATGGRHRHAEQRTTLPPERRTPVRPVRLAPAQRVRAELECGAQAVGQADTAAPRRSSRLSVSFATKRFWTARREATAPRGFGDALARARSGVAAALCHRRPKRLSSPATRREPVAAPTTAECICRASEAHNMLARQGPD